ncbi:MAG: PQQ-binding-like beta-propeller repeat protein [Pirellulaceae bacterium]|nr:PQQ-binding-like beta-propeller repeat protein [Pirellulaceae bacterium]
MTRFKVWVCCLLSVCASTVNADDWANWRGPEQNGVSRERGLVSNWSLDGQNIKWQSEIGGRATPIIMGNRVYLNCRTLDDVLDPVEKINAGEQVVCWDLETGNVLWRERFNVFQTDIATSRVGWASMCGDTETGNVYVHTVSGIFRCYDRDGNVIWQRSLVEEYGEILGYGGRIQNPIIDENLVIISFLAANWGATRGPGPMHYYYAFDKSTGDLQWVSAPGKAPEGTNYSIPVVTVVDGQRMLIGGNGDGGVYAMNARTGKPLWGFVMSKSAINASPVVVGNRVFVSHGQDNVDSPEFGSVRCIDISVAMTDMEKATVWRKDGIKADYSSPLFYDGVLYVMSDTGNLFALDADTGDELWVQNCGTVGKGAPVWADGKIYLTETNGNVWILQPTREKCEVLSHVRLPALVGKGDDEIYASFAISNGYCLLVTRDRTICISAGPNSGTDPIPEMPAETPAEDEIALVQLRPYETVISADRPQSYVLHCFDRMGHLIKTVEPELTLSNELQGMQVEGSNVSVSVMNRDFAGTVSTTFEGLEATARIRAFNGTKEWFWDFDGTKGTETPPTWLRAFAKAKPIEIDGNTALGLAGIGAAKGRPSHTMYIGSPTMSNYTIQADVHMTAKGRTLPNIGVLANRYTFLIKGNYNKVEVQSWQAHLHNAKDAKFDVVGSKWYTLKFTVKIEDGQAKLFGKAWAKGDEEPAEWTIEHVDPNPNETGSPGLYVYATNDCAFDNVRVTFHD